MLNGDGIDEVYASAGASSSLLTDGIGSTVAITDSAGNISGSYTYGPYGNTSHTGSATAANQYSGRENDGDTNLYYYRARYYSPTLNRFISQDPIGLGGGMNVYAYAGDDPTDLADPTGNCPWCVAAGIGSIIGAGFNAYNNYSAYKNEQITGDQYFTDIIIGAETGALAALPGLGGIGSGLIIGGLASGSNEALQELENGCLDPKKIGLATAVGGAGSLLGPFGRALGSRIPTSVLGNLETAPRGYPNAGSLVGFSLSAIASGLYP
jgi:RHS repeat-associated protein